MQLYYTQSSPYAHCVLTVISEIGIKAQINFVECPPFDNEGSFLKSNPLGKVPCLVDNGEPIGDSEVICDYLDANFTGGTLFNPIYADWRLKTFYSLCSGLMDVCVARRIEIMRKDENTQSAFWLQRQTDAINRTLIDIEQKMDLIPDEFSILHINLLSCLGYLDFRHSDILWREENSQLAAFFESFKTRPCVVDNQYSA